VRRVREADGELRIVLPDSAARRIFEITGLDEVLDVHATRAAALERTAGA
jgi:anti-anti-sigma regulatory factor